MPDRGFALVYFNDDRWRSFAELHSTIVKARDLALRDAEIKHAAAAVERWLLAELEKDRATGAAPGDNRVTLSYIRGLVSGLPRNRRLPCVLRPLVPSKPLGSPNSPDSAAHQ
jgi:hypothetical protein